MVCEMPYGCWWSDSAADAYLHFHHCPIARVLIEDDGTVRIRILTKRSILPGSAGSLAQGKRFVLRYYTAHGLPFTGRAIKGRGPIRNEWLARFLADRRAGIVQL